MFPHVTLGIELVTDAIGRADGRDRLWHARYRLSFERHTRVRCKDQWLASRSRSSGHRVLLDHGHYHLGIHTSVLLYDSKVTTGEASLTDIFLRVLAFGNKRWIFINQSYSWHMELKRHLHLHDVMNCIMQFTMTTLAIRQHWILLAPWRQFFVGISKHREESWKYEFIWRNSRCSDN